MKCRQFCMILFVLMVVAVVAGCAKKPPQEETNLPFATNNAPLPTDTDAPADEAAPNDQSVTQTPAEVREVVRKEASTPDERAREKAKTTACLANVKMLGLAIRMYEEDYDERTPLPKNVVATIHPYMLNRDVWYCPSKISRKPGYALVRSFTDRKFSTFNNPAEQFAIFEANLDEEPLVGDKKDVADPARHVGGNVFGYVDGHARWLLSDREAETGWSK